MIPEVSRSRRVSPPTAGPGPLFYPERRTGGHVHRPSANRQSDDTKDDVAELRRQAANAPTATEAAELEWMAQLYEHEDRLHARTVRDLKRVYRTSVAELRKLSRDGDVRVRAALIRGDEAQLYGLLRAAGVEEAEINWQAGLDEGVALAAQWEKLNGLPAPVRSPDIEPFLAYDAAVRRGRGLYRDAVIAPSLEVMREGLQGALLLERLPDAANRIAQRLDVSQRQAVSEARTRAAMFDRAVIDNQAARHGVDSYVYRGPLDGVTRPFCRACLRLSEVYWSRDMVARLSNGQTAVAPLFACGGHNCRHLLVPVTQESIEDRGLRRATLADVRAVNGAALKGRKRKR